MMRRIVCFLLLLVSCSFSAHLKDGNSGSGYDFSDTSAQGLHQSMKYLGDEFMEGISMRRQACKWATLLGDPYVTCEIPYGGVTPNSMGLKAEGAILLTCGETLMGSALVTFEQSRDHSMLRWSGASFDWGNVMVMKVSPEDASKNSDSRRCQVDRFQVSAVLYHSVASVKIKGRRVEQERSWLRNRVGGDVNTTPDEDPNTVAILKAKAKKVAAACLNSGESYCKKQVEEMQKMKEGTEKEKIHFIDQMKGYFMEEYKNMDSKQATDCEKSPNSWRCKERQKSLEKCRDEDGLRCLPPSSASQGRRG